MTRAPHTRTSRPRALGTLAARVLTTQLTRAQRNLPGAAKCRNPERIHDMRVAIRRARVALKVFAPCAPSAAWRPVRKELAWLAGYLGAVRDCDVGLAAFDQLCAGSLLSAHIIDRLRACLLEIREQHVAALRKVLSRPRAAAALAALATAARTARACRTPGARKPAKDFLAAAILSTLKDLLASGDEDVTQLFAEHLHQLRIAFKRLRYLCEFAQPFYRRALAVPIASCVAIQDCLGRHQDLATLCTQLEQLARRSAKHGKHAAQLVLACGALVERAHAAMAIERASFADLWRHFPASAAHLRSVL